jgi:hypothetical protein
MIMLIATNPQIMKDKVNGPVSSALGWITTIVMTIAAGASLLSFIFRR